MLTTIRIPPGVYHVPVNMTLGNGVSLDTKRPNYKKADRSKKKLSKISRKRNRK